MRKLSPRELSFELPEGWGLKEEEDFLHLFFKEKKVATFSAYGVTPEAILETIQEFEK